MAIDLDAERAELIAQLRAASYRTGGSQSGWSDGPEGRPFFCVSVPRLRRIVRAWLAAHRQGPDGELLAMTDRLFRGEAFEEKLVGAIMLQTTPQIQAQVTPAIVDRWLDDLRGWAEIDSLCASGFWAEALAADWPSWRALVEWLAGDPNINKRRAALVLLTAPTRRSDDLRFADLAFEVVERLKDERPILITKAVSWLLRSMAPRHGAAVGAYLAANAASLPAIAVRETRTKLTTGTKTGRSRHRDTVTARAD
jgi:3-methyladenine DNA glycosylase AlkD